MDEEKLKQAFKKVKQDIDFLATEFSQIKQEIQEINQFLQDFSSSTLRQITSTHPVTSTQTSTVPQEIGGLRTPNLGISIGNRGASTDRQTDRQTDNSTHIYTKNQENQENQEKPAQLTEPDMEQEIEPNIEKNIQKASEILDSLDALKKQIRLKFKRITPQEMSVFSTIYQLEEQDPKNTTYNQIAKILHLSQSSIRDYVQRMINKGIPIKKHKINNKKVILSISSELKKIASLSTIIKLREL